jgi:hypothetical protein
VSNPILDGNRGKRAGCTTTACNGSVVGIAHGVHVDLHLLTVRENVTGGAIVNNKGGTLDLKDCTVSNNSDVAVDNADGTDGGSGVLIVSGSLFSHNEGGAVDNADDGGTGMVTITGSTFLDNQGGNGGAIDNADATDLLQADAWLIGDKGSGTVTIAGSIFSGNKATGNGGAIDNGDGGAQIDEYGILAITSSTFSDNTAAGNGGAIANAEGQGFPSDNPGLLSEPFTDGSGTAAIYRSTFSGDRAMNGGAIDNASGGWSPTVAGAGNIGTDTRGTGKLQISTSTFAGDSANDGVEIDSSDGTGSSGELYITASTFLSGPAHALAIASGYDSGRGIVAVAADIFAGSCWYATGQPWQDAGFNVGSDRTCLNSGSADVDYGPGLADLLGPLAANGGPTKTMAPRAGNPATGLIPVSTTVMISGKRVELCPTTDQRGVKSNPGHTCNAGAVQ